MKESEREKRIHGNKTFMFCDVRLKDKDAKGKKESEHNLKEKEETDQLIRGVNIRFCKNNRKGDGERRMSLRA